MNKRYVAALIISVAVAFLAAYFASEHPDGLERVAESLGFIGREKDAAFSVMPDYGIQGKSGAAWTFVAGAIGVAATFALVLLVGKLFRKR